MRLRSKSSASCTSRRFGPRPCSHQKSKMKARTARASSLNSKPVTWWGTGSPVVVAGRGSVGRAVARCAGAAGSGRLGGEHGGQGTDAADERPGHDLGAGDPRRRADVGQAPQQLLEEHPQFEAGQRGAEAEVGAEAERDVVVGGAGDV